MLNDPDPTPAAAAQLPYQVTVQHGEGEVLIQVTGGGGRQGGLDTESVVAFLSALDAEQVEKDVLAGLGLLEGDGGETFTKALLKRLIVIAQGAW